MMSKRILAGFGALLAGALFAADPSLSDLNCRRDDLLSRTTLETIAATDPLLGEWLAAQKKILTNLERAIERDAEQTASLKADYDYLLTRLAEEIEFARNTPVIDESRHYNVRDFGARGDGSADDGEALRKAIAAAAADTTGRRTVFLPRGRYLIRCVGPETGNVKLDNLKNLRLVGEHGTEILLPGPLDVAIRILNCDNVGVKNLTLTYRKVPYTTGVITGFPADDTIRVVIDPGMTAPTEPMFREAQTRGLMRVYSPERIPGSLRPARSSVAPHQGAPTATRIDDNTFDFKLNSFTPTAKHYTIGSRIALYARTYGNHTINNANSSRTRLENITINTSSAMAILNNSAERPFVVNCKVEALPGSFVSTSADGIYMRNISLGGLVKGNGIRHVGDDFMNIHSYVHPAAKTDGKTIYVNSSDWDPRTLAAGRRLGLIRASAGETGVEKEARILSVEPEGRLLKVTLDTPFGPFETLETTRDIPDMLMLPDNQSHGLVITGNRFEDGVSRFLAGGRNWLFVDNVVIDSLSHPFFMNIRPEAVGRNGFEFVAPRNIEISGNRFQTEAKTLFRIGAGAAAPGKSTPTASHIRIIDNEIDIVGSSDLPLIEMEGSAYLTVSGNDVDAVLPQSGGFVRQQKSYQVSIPRNHLSGNLGR